LVQAYIKTSLVFNETPLHEDELESRFISPPTLNLGSRLRTGVSFMPWLLYPGWKQRIFVE